jgi:hypothetical protein
MDGPILLKPNITPERQAEPTPRARQIRPLYYKVNAP